MNGLYNSRLIWVLKTHSRIFWVVFAITGGIIFFRLPFLEIVLGIAVILFGIGKIVSEAEQIRLAEERKEMQSTLKEIRDFLQEEFRYVQGMRARYDARFFSLDRKRAETDMRIERNYRELVRKILNVENRMSDISKAVKKTRTEYVLKYIRGLRISYNKRLFILDRKRATSVKRIEKNYRQLARKRAEADRRMQRSYISLESEILKIENRIGNISQALKKQNK